jgi:hypothetical protein
LTYVVTFSDYEPTPRFDDVPWTTLRIEESVGFDGPWTEIDTVILQPTDPDPEHPMSRSFTTDSATLQNGWYRVSFIDDLGNVLYTDPIFNRAGSRDQNYFPTVRNVGSKLMSRTKDQFGNLCGTFTSETTPTNDQAESVIEGIITEIADVIGDKVPAELIDDAQNVTALRAAMQIELDFFADQVNTGRSIYPQLRDQYDIALKNLSLAVNEYGTSDGDVQASGTGGDPNYAFPPVYYPDWYWVTE